MATPELPRASTRAGSPRLPARLLTSGGALLLAAWMLAGCSADDPVMSTGKPWRTHYTGFEVHVTHENGVPAADVPVEVTLMDRFTGGRIRTHSGVTDGQGRFRRPSVGVLNLYGPDGGYFTPLEVSAGPPSGGAQEPAIVLDSIWVVDSADQVVVSIYDMAIP
jgi:hypothetical protein